MLNNINFTNLFLYYTSIFTERIRTVKYKFSDAKG